MPYERKKKWFGFLFVVPWLIGFAYFFLVPFVSSFFYSLYEKVSPAQGGMQFLGFAGIRRYVEALSADTPFILQLTFTLQRMVYQVPLVLVFSIFLAVILNTRFRGRLLARGIFFLPVIIASGIVINILRGDTVASDMMAGERGSALFQGIQFEVLLLQVGVPVDVTTWLMQVINGIFELVWKSGVQTLLMLSGLQSIPHTVYEAADIEGATAWETFWKITMPMASPHIILCAFYTIVDISTDYSNLIILRIRDIARNLDLAYASVLSIIWFAIIMALVGLVFLLTRRMVYYNDDRG